MATVDIECHIGKTSNTFPFPAGFSGEPKFIQAHILKGSKGVINLRPINHSDKESLVADNQSYVDALDLHRCAQKLTGNSPRLGRVDRIALILADRYKPRPGVLGVMFDRGYPTDDDPNNSSVFTGAPREGCAIFIGAINELRPNIGDFNREVEFTAIHELGHIFNLDHASSEKSFMATSKMNTPFSNEYFQFFDSQQSWLSECDSNPSVYPGGSKFQPVLGFNTVTQPKKNNTAVQFTLHIGMANSTFPCSCPVELDIKLKNSSEFDKNVYVPDRLDPGYVEFKIWITNPSNEKKLFRSPRKYCAPVSKVLLKSGHSIYRDISIFEGASGTTFSIPGIYHIQAEFNLGGRGLIVSNVVTVEAVVNKLLMPTERVHLLSDYSVRRFLYHRSNKCDLKVIQTLQNHLMRYPKGPCSNDIRYALIRALCADTAAINKVDKKKIISLIYDAKNIDGALCSRQVHHLQRLFDTLSI